jgi:hypothetical protein
MRALSFGDQPSVYLQSKEWNKTLKLVRNESGRLVYSSLLFSSLVSLLWTR